MSYKKLANYISIISRDDFEYIADSRNIKYIIHIVSNVTSSPDRNDINYLAALDEYLTHFTNFYNWINNERIPDLNESMSLCKEVFDHVRRLIHLPDAKRQAIPTSYKRRLKKTFYYSLSRLLSGIRLSFHPDLISSTRISDEQLVRYFYDPKEGLGKKYHFNRNGQHSFANKVARLSRKELIATERLLVQLPANLIRRFNGWIDLGANNSQVRILLMPSTLGKDGVCFLYRTTDTDKRPYIAQLNTPPSRVDFDAV